LIQTGVGLQNAQKACQKVFGKTQYHLAISSGFAGALFPSSIGALVIPKTVVLGEADSSEGFELSPFPCSGEYSSIIHRVLESLKLPFLSEMLVTVSWIVWSASEKHAIAKKYQASALDMESAGIAAMAQEYHVPFLVIRTVSDLRDENLPQEFNFFLSPSTWIQGLWRMVSRPALWFNVYRLRQQTNIASRELTRFFEMFVAHLRQQ
jgi:adenosylhomocysteine nucleosidase